MFEKNFDEFQEKEFARDLTHSPVPQELRDVECITPPLRSDNPLCFDSQFYSLSQQDQHDSDFTGVELGIFNFSPPVSRQTITSH